MATRGWGGSVALAVGVAAGTAAAQLGVGYGLGILAWTSATDTTGVSTWLASLAWTTWIAATSTVVGSIAADRLSSGRPGAAPGRRRTAGTEAVSRSGLVANTAWRLVVALTAAIGGLLTVPLVAVPARAAHRPDTFAPQTIAGGYAIVGVAVGLIVAIAALTSRAVAANVLATAGWLWALAIASALYGVAGDKGLTSAQLAVWRFGGRYFLEKIFSLPGAALMMGVALIIGVLAAWPAGRRGDNRVGVAVSGAAGPLVVAAAYFLAAPKLVGIQADEQLSAYLIAPYAVIAGLAGSVLLSGLMAHREQRRELDTQLPVPLPVQASPPTIGTGSGFDDYAQPHAVPFGGEPALVAASAAESPTADLPVAGRAPVWPDDDVAAEPVSDPTAKPARNKGRR
jgi:MFS family permease